MGEDTDSLPICLGGACSELVQHQAHRTEIGGRANRAQCVLLRQIAVAAAAVCEHNFVIQRHPGAFRKQLEPSRKVAFIAAIANRLAALIGLLRVCTGPCIQLGLATGRFHRHWVTTLVHDRLPQPPLHLDATGKGNTQVEGGPCERTHSYTGSRPTSGPRI